MSDQDDPDVIEQEPRHVSIPRMPWLPAGKRPATFTAAVVAAVLLAVAGTFAGLRLTSGGPADPGLAGLITEVTTVPVGPPAPAGLVPDARGTILPTIPPTIPPPPSGTSGYASTLLIAPGSLVPVSGPPLTEAGKPEVLYVATEYCPYCAVENWALIVALSRFGHFTGLTTSRSPQFEGVPPIDTWTFYGSSYTSPYLAFVPVETHSNVLVSPKADKENGASYRVLQRLTPAEQAVIDKYDSKGSTPFIDFANQVAQAGSGIPTNLLAGRTWQQLAAALRQPETPLGAALLNEADTLTTALCRLTDGRPAACSQSPGPAGPSR